MCCKGSQAQLHRSMDTLGAVVNGMLVPFTACLCFFGIASVSSYIGIIIRDAGKLFQLVLSVPRVYNLLSKFKGAVSMTKREPIEKTAKDTDISKVTYCDNIGRDART